MQMNELYLPRMNLFPPEPFGGDDGYHDALEALSPLIVSMRRQLAPPLRFGARRLHRMHVIVMNPHSPFEVPSPANDLVLPQLSPRSDELQARPVLGEILRGERGEWYERIGQRIRPLRGLVSGPDGEVLEVQSFASPAQPPEDWEPEDEQESDEAEGFEPAGATSRPVPPAATPFRRLLPERGTWRILVFGAYKPILAPQLAQPGRLRDSHHLPCYAQVIEATAAVGIEALTEAVLGEGSDPNRLVPLTPALASQLGLAPLLPAPPRVPPYSPSQGSARPGQRFLQLTIASDPTAKVAPAPEPVAPATPAPGPTPAAVVAPMNAVPAESGPAPRATGIPAQWMRAGEFRISREQAARFLHRAGSLWQRLTRPFRRARHHAAFRQWQLKLSGRSVDEQLWSVPPPRGWLGDPWLREWAWQTLELGHYDADALVSEWEIFWARKQTP